MFQLTSGISRYQQSIPVILAHITMNMLVKEALANQWHECCLFIKAGADPGGALGAEAPLHI